MSVYKDIATEAYEMGADGFSSETTFKTLSEKYPDLISNSEKEALFDFWLDGNVEYHLEELELSESQPFPREI